MQNTFYNMCLELTEKFKGIVSFLDEHNPKIIENGAILNDRGASVFYVHNANLNINPNFFIGVK